MDTFECLYLVFRQGLKFSFECKLAEEVEADIVIV